MMFSRLKLRTQHYALGTLILCLAQLSLAQEPKPESPTYLGRKIAQTMHYAGANWLTRHEREQEEASETHDAVIRLEAKEK